MNIIIAEKSLEIAHEFSYMLLSFGITSITAGNRSAALKILEENPEINLGIIDIDNKIVEGIELIEELTAKTTPPFRIIIHSAVSIDELPEKIAKEYIIGYIPKPFDYPRVESSLKIIFSSINFPDIDKREHIRIIPDKDDLLRVHCKLKGYSHLVCGKILNLSLGGIAVELLNLPIAEVIKEGTKIPVVEFTINCRRISTTGTIFLNRGKIIVIHFDNLNREKKNIIARYILKRIS